MIAKRIKVQRLFADRLHRGNQPMTRTAAIATRVELSVKKAAEKAALADHRSLASLIEKLLIEFLKREGYLKGK
jgi:hypothetical protein